MELVREEDKGGVGGLIELAPKTLQPDPSVEPLDEETVARLQEMLRDWTHK